jgi:tRNA A-37 threonylcarbamoyl transferase component Bud32
MDDEALESRVLRFEEAWVRAAPPRLADFLDDPPALSSADRARLFVELIAVDLELRWRNARHHNDPRGRMVLEDYVARFPELASLDRLPLELIGEEYRVRCRWGDRPSHEDVMSRFPARREEIRTELLRVDREIEAESVDTGPMPQLGDRATPLEPLEEDRAGPWLSHRDFLLQRLIGAGRIGKVYQARQHGASREVAVKFLRKSFLQEPLIVRRFIGEARTVAGLRHPNIVQTEGLGRTGGGSYFIVMDLVDGPDLERLARTRTISISEAIQWTVEACAALGHAHEMGVIHCDLKPANLLLDVTGGIRVTDFGLARSLSEHTPGSAEIEGTAPFMAPEQVSRSWGRIDQRTDVYGMGATLFTLLTGRPPHVGRRLPDILADVVSAAPVFSATRLRPDLPQSAGELCRRCLRKAPEERFQTVTEVRAALVDLIRHEARR